MGEREERVAISLTPKGLAETMRILSREVDIERRHIYAIGMLCAVLEDLGYEEAIAEFKKMRKWYS